MVHSKTCMEILSELDFPESSYMWLESILLKHSKKQIISLVDSKDPDGEHSWSWFTPFFCGYVKPILDYVVILDDSFWIAYDIICSFVEPFQTSDMELIKRMSHDIDRIHRAISKSKPNIRYVAKVWNGLPPTMLGIERSYEIPDIKKHNVEIRIF